jgi:uncharacterized protein YaeQ
LPPAEELPDARRPARRRGVHGRSVVHQGLPAYDRQTTRYEFAQIADVAVKAYAQSAKLWLMTNIKEASDGGYLDADQVDEAQIALIADVADKTHAARDLARLLKQCPRKEDKVH